MYRVREKYIFEQDFHIPGTVIIKCLFFYTAMLKTSPKTLANLWALREQFNLYFF